VFVRTADFVQFNLVAWFGPTRSGECVGFLKKGELPPEEEVSSKRYHLFPYPLRDPLASHLFMHAFLNPTIHYKRLALNLLPKKLGTRLSCVSNPLTTGLNPEPAAPVGWGIYVIEGPNWPIIRLWVFGGLHIIGVISVLWCTLRHDVQGGMAIGALLVALLVAYITVKVYGWSEGQGGVELGP